MKILYVSTVSGTMGFFDRYINQLLDEGHNVDFACNLKKEIDTTLINRGCRVFDIKFERSIGRINNLKSIKEIRQLVEKEKYDIVHTHTPIASVIVRIACRKLLNTKIIYTAHGFHFFKGSPLLSWIIYYPIEKICSYFTDALITINSEDYHLAQKKMKAKKIYYVAGVGIDTQKIREVKVDKIKKRREIGIPEDAIILLSVGELNKNKNHEIIIKAINEIQDKNIYYCIAGDGILKEYLEELINELKLKDRVKLLGYRVDVKELYKAADIFCFPSYREGLSVALMESMASGLPVICSGIRGNVDLIQKNLGGYSCSPKDRNEFKNAIEKLCSNQQKRLEMIKFNKQHIEKFDNRNVDEYMNGIYRRVLNE